MNEAAASTRAGTARRLRPFATFHDAVTRAGGQARQVLRIYREAGYDGLSDRVRRVLVSKLAPTRPQLLVRTVDIVAPLPEAAARRPMARSGKGPTTLNWLVIPPAANSGGHTTLFRMINWLEGANYQNRVYLYDNFQSDHAHYAGIIRNRYGFSGIVRPYADGMEDADGVLATSWPTAYAAMKSPCAGKRFYFVQDFEPYFYPVGSEHVLAEDTYRMGFHGITAGSWLARKLRTEYGMRADHFEFGCDTSRYVRREGRRNGVAFYARSDTPRRGYELGILALQIFAERHPGVDLHLYGGRVGKLPFRFVNHGSVDPGTLNEIYNQCFAGLSLSLTNLSLVPHEMLAAGCIPVVNDAPHNRDVLDNPFVRYCAPTPHALAAALHAVSVDPALAELSREGAASVRTADWGAAGRTVDAILQRELATGAEPALA